MGPGASTVTTGKNKNPLCLPSIEPQILGDTTHSQVAILTEPSGHYIVVLQYKELNQVFFPPRRPGFKPGSGDVGFCDG
jgi:hypothetical protein